MEMPNTAFILPTYEIIEDDGAGRGMLIILVELGFIIILIGLITNITPLLWVGIIVIVFFIKSKIFIVRRKKSMESISVIFAEFLEE